MVNEQKRIKSEEKGKFNYSILILVMSQLSVREPSVLTKVLEPRIGCEKSVHWYCYFSSNTLKKQLIQNKHGDRICTVKRL